LPERRRMMQAWADYLDQLKAQIGEGKLKDLEQSERRRMSKTEAAAVARHARSMH